AYEIVYFWGLVGATNAVVTPQLEFGYPQYRFFQYFIAHGGIVAAALFATWGLGMRPTGRSVLRVFVLLNLLAIVLIGVNLMLESNYMFLCQPPTTKSPFFFLPWPWYLLFLDGVALVLFYVLFILFAKRKLYASNSLR
ncbi:MAG: TIGR02206 family membrane protein, partial [Gemmatimonadetes bacterium]|nr:TIGR02206 family membrane protein [Gemmatimonadota bacterium]